MKIKIEIDEGLPEDEVLIRCRGLTEQIADVQKAVSEVINTSQKFVFYCKGRVPLAFKSSKSI